MRITENVHALHHPFTIQVTPELKLERFVYSFMILGKEKVYLVDSGLKNSFDTINHYLNRIGRGMDQVSMLFLTHSHPDHIGSAKQIKDNSNCKVLAHESEKEWIENINKQFADRPVPGFNNLVDNSVKIDEFLIDQQSIILEENLTLRVVHTPGHSKGSVSLLLEEKDILFCGDVLLLPGDLPIYENVADAVASIKKLNELKNVKILLSSWDNPTFDAEIDVKIKNSLNYFKILHNTILGTENAHNLDPMVLCKNVIEKLGMPPVAVIPLVAKSFQSNLQVKQEIIF